MTMQCATVNAQVLSHTIGRAQTGSQGQIDAFARVVPHRGMGAGRHSIKILLNVARDCRVRRGNGSIDVVREADDPVVILTELDIGSEKPAMCISSGGCGVCEANRLRPPPSAKQLAEASVDETEPEFHSLSDRQRAP